MYARSSRRERTKRLIRLSVLILTVICLYGLIRGKKQTIISPLADEQTQTTPQPTTQESSSSFLKLFSGAKKPEELRTVVKQHADSRWKNYSIVVSDLNSAFQMSLNESTIFDGASVNKVPILVTLYHQVQQGEIDLSDTITLQSKDIQDYGTGSMRYDNPGSVYSLQTLARLMIQKSDNTAAYILANHIVGQSNIQAYIESLGTTQTNMEKNTTSNRDMQLLFSAMFTGKIADEAHTREMIGFLRDTDFEDRLPAQLPEKTVVYHKIGTGIGAVHDVGVVESGSTKYYIGIFTSNITDEERTSEEVAYISKLIYEFMAD
jgi:beta-lactamase class A